MTITTTFNTARTILESPLGALVVWATSNNHVGISTGGGRDEEDAVDHVTINRVAYSLRIDVHPEAYFAAKAKAKADNGGRGGSWQEEPSDYVNGWATGRGYNPITRKDWQNVREMHGSFTTQNKARAIILAWITEWLATDDGKALLTAGQAIHDRNERATLVEERAGLVARIAEIDAQLDVLPS